MEAFLKTPALLIPTLLIIYFTLARSYRFVSQTISQIFGQTKLIIIIAVVGALAYCYINTQPSTFSKFIKSMGSIAISIIKR